MSLSADTLGLNPEQAEESEAVQVSINAPDVVPPDSDFTAPVDISHVGPTQYGGILNLATTAGPEHFDDAAVLTLREAPTLALTNEDLIKGDWAKGPAGTGESTWIYTMMPSL